MSCALASSTHSAWVRVWKYGLQLLPQGGVTAPEIDRMAAVDVTDQVVASDGGTEMLPELGFDTAKENKPPVLRLVKLIFGTGSVRAGRHARSIGNPIDIQGVGHANPAVGDNGVGRRHVDKAALTCSIPGPEAGGYVVGRIDGARRRPFPTRVGVNHGLPAGLGGPGEAILAHLHRRRAGQGIHHLTMGRYGRIRTGGSEPAVLAVDDVGLAPALRFVADAEPGAGVRTRCRRQRHRQWPAASRTPPYPASVRRSSVRDRLCLLTCMWAGLW